MKKRWLALLLNLFMGLGYLYIGKVKKALYFVFLPYLIVLVALYLERYIPYIIFLVILGCLVAWIYSFIDIWKSFPLDSSTNLSYSKWYYILLLIGANYLVSYPLHYFVENYAPIRFFIAPSNSMASTIVRGDYFIVERTKDIKRGDVAIFRYPPNPKIFYDKRVVAVGGDEIVYQDKHLYVHFSEGDEYIKHHYKSEKIKKFREKLWVDNPYMDRYSGIQYVPEHGEVFSALIAVSRGRIPRYSRNMSPIYIKELGDIIDKTQAGKPMNAFYKKVEDGHYYMLGDNRDNSADSRFWGSVPKENIFGLVKRVYFNIHSFNRFFIDIK